MPISLRFAPPFAFTRFDGEQNDDDVEAYIRRFGEIHARRQLYVGVTWMKSYSQSPATIARMGRWLKESEAQTREYCAGAALISTSATFRFALSSVFLIKPMVCPYVVCETFPDAIAFLQAQAERRGLRLPAAVESPWPDLPAKAG